MPDPGDEDNIRTGPPDIPRFQDAVKLGRTAPPSDTMERIGRAGDAKLLAWQERLRALG